MASTSAGTLELVALELGRAMEPLAGRFHDAHHSLMFLAELGLKLPEGSISPALVSAFTDIHEAAHDLPDVTQDLLAAIQAEDVGAIIAEGVSLAKDVAALVTAFDEIGQTIDGLNGVNGISNAEIQAFAAALPKHLFETVAIDYMEANLALPLGIFEILGLVERTRRNRGSTDLGNPEFIERTLRFDRVGKLLSSPDELFDDLYQWGKPGFDGGLLVQRVGNLLRALEVPVTHRLLPGTPPRPAIEVATLTLAPTAPPIAPGLELTFAMDIGDGLAVEVPIASGWAGRIAVDGALGASAAMRIVAPADVTVEPPSGTAQGRLTIGIKRAPVAPADRISLIGVTGGTGLSAQSIELKLITGFRWESASGEARGDIGFGGEIQGGKLRIAMDGADGFLGKILGGAAIEADFNLGLGWTAGEGVYFTGSAMLEIQLPLHIAIGPVELDALTLRMGIEGNAFPISLATNIKAALGPINAVVEQVGASVALSFANDAKGDIGPLDLAFRFLPPKGVGLSIDVGVVKGGGYLFIDTDRGEYAGALELSLAEIVTVQAIGLITTKLPDGSKGFSLLIMMSVEWGTGIQLGYGFTLKAVGGLVGLNRTMKLEALAEGIRSGAIESVMFPKNIVANAPKIISDLRAFFPQQQGRFLVGPMVKLGWGTPTLISVSLGIIIEIPGNIAIVGIIKVALPTEDAAIIKIQVNFIGAIEFDKQRLWFFAALFDSRVLFLTLEGEMGLLVAWGDNANFVLSVGGFHPRFNPPALPFGTVRRIAINILNTPVARIRVEGYFAVTSNTVQFGARVELYFGFSILNVQGHLAFDALFQFSPFQFIIDVSASFSVKVFGAGLFSVRLSGSLSGPAPWHISGRGELTILFWDIEVEIDETWGEDKREELAPIEVLPILAGELRKDANWRALPPPSSSLFVSLRTMPEAEAALLLHPLGRLHVSQRAVPLGLKLDKVGSRKPSDVNRLSIVVKGGGLERKKDTIEQFAPAQYQNFSDAEKLSRPAFAPEKGGLELSVAGNDTRSHLMVRRAVRFEEIIIDSNYKRFQRRFRFAIGALFNFFAANSAAAKTELSAAGKKALQPYADKIEIVPDAYAVVLQSSNKAFAADSVSFMSEASARDYLGQQVANDVTLANEIQVVPAVEMAA